MTDASVALAPDASDAGSRTLDAGVGVSCTVAADCAPEEFCSNGACVPDVCQPGTSVCLDRSRLAACNPEGDALGPTFSCAAAQTCIQTGTNAGCQDRVCAPGSDFCDPSGTRVNHCSADGLSVTGSSRCAAGSKCNFDAGTCEQVTCDPGSTRCRGLTALECDVDGFREFVREECTTDQFCSATGPDGAACFGQLCKPGQAVCSRNTVTTCNADGSGYVAAPTDVNCSAVYSLCLDATCHPVLCVAHSVYCDGNTIADCGPDGTTTQPRTTCGAGQFCDILPSGSVLCRPTLCTPGQPACDGGVSTVCDSLGAGFLHRGTDVDCASSGMSCSSGACVTTTPLVDSLGDTKTPGSGASRTRLNSIAVTSDRTLVQIEFQLSLTVSAALTWVVYEKLPDPATTYALVATSDTTAQPGTGYFASGPLGVRLVAGHSYAIGVGWGATTVGYDYGATKPVLGFGQFVAGITLAGLPPVTFTGNTAPANVYMERLSTIP